MNLYKILIQHFSQKDSKTGMVCLVLAKDDKSVYEWLKSEPTVGDTSIWHSWEDRQKDGYTRDIYTEDGIVVGQETWDEYMLRIGGEINDEDFENQDAYYGNTLYGWEMIKENCETDYSELAELNIVVKL